MTTRITGRGATTALLALLAVAAWSPTFARPVSPDEGGFLIVASQWRAGRSLYGDYWVDRPPLLIALHALADAAGGLPALRVLGAAAVAGTVLLAGVLAAVANPSTGRRPQVPTWVAAVLVASPLLGSTEVAGELLTTPIVLGGLVCLMRALRAERARAVVGWTVATGALGVAAPLIKQNAVDVGLAAGVVVLGLLIRRDRRWWPLTGGVAAGAIGTLAVVLAAAAMRGTDPGPLFQAVVTFRLHAGQLLQQRAPTSDALRLRRLLTYGALGGLPLLWLCLGLRVRHRATGPLPDLRWVALALLAWESVAVLGGGSYWLHYLLDLVPGTVLLALAAGQPRVTSSGTDRAPATRLLGAALTITAVTTIAAVAASVADRSALDSDHAVISWLRSHARAGDTATVAFGHADILYGSGLRSPYVNMWSLPTRVRDPHLDGLRAVLRSRRAPTWLVVPGAGLGSWGAHSHAAERTLERRYRLVVQLPHDAVWRHRSAR